MNELCWMDNFIGHIKITQKNVVFLISSDYWNTWVNFNLLMRQINL